MFRSYSKTSGYFLRDYVAKAMVIMLSSRVKAHLVFHWCLYNYLPGSRATINFWICKFINNASKNKRYKTDIIVLTFWRKLFSDKV